VKETHITQHHAPFRIYFSVSSEGYGHSTRAMALARYFEHHEYLIGSYGIALDRMRDLNFHVTPIPQELKIMGSKGGFDVTATILNSQNAVLKFNQHIQDEMDIMREYGVTLVVADGRIAPVIAAARMDIPCLVLTNQSAFYPFFARDTPLVKVLGKSFEWLMKFWLSSAEDILVPDFPPPYSICLPNLSMKPKVKKRTRFLGPLAMFNPSDVIPVSIKEAAGKTLVVVSLGGHDYRQPLFDAVLEVAEQFPSYHFAILTTFTASKGIASNITLHHHINECAGFFKAAHIVITQAGHSSAMELLTLGKPCVVVPDSNQIEQEHNAQRMVDLGVAIQLEYPNLSSKTLAATLRDVEAQYDSLASHASNFARFASELNGSERGAGILRHYAQRLRNY
jgi:UDP-N-acetylglucosamine--N-acetylmuramyl-(pentapeptide) pyrophosphoryl-undecaprenol N-acetylglucosamine transferase